MYRVPPPPPDPLTAARQTIKNCSGIMIGVAVISVITIALTLFQLTFRPPMFGQGHQTAQLIELQRQMRYWMCVVGLTWGAISAAWGLLNAWGLRGMQRWSRYSSLFYSFFLVFTCIGATFGGFLLYLLLKRDVKAAFDAGPAPVTPPVV